MTCERRALSVALLRRCGAHLRCRPGKGIRHTAIGPQRAFLRLRARLLCGFRYIYRDADVHVAIVGMAGLLSRCAVRREVPGDLGRSKPRSPVTTEKPIRPTRGKVSWVVAATQIGGCGF